MLQGLPLSEQAIPYSRGTPLATALMAEAEVPATCSMECWRQYGNTFRLFYPVTLTSAGTFSVNYFHSPIPQFSDQLFVASDVTRKLCKFGPRKENVRINHFLPGHTHSTRMKKAIPLRLLSSHLDCLVRTWLAHHHE